MHICHRFFNSIDVVFLSLTKKLVDKNVNFFFSFTNILSRGVDKKKLHLFCIKNKIIWKDICDNVEER